MEGLYYAASHGFDILEPRGQASELTQVATEYLPLLAEVRKSIDAKLGDLEGAFVEVDICNPVNLILSILIP